MEDKILGVRLKKARGSRTQKEICKILGISIGTLSGYERGYRKPDPVTLAKLAELYGVKTDYLLGLSNGHYKSTDSNVVYLVERGQARTLDGAIRVPLVGRIHAGEPILAYEEHDEDRFYPPSYIKAGFEHIVLRVIGDCMDGGKNPIRDGDEVLVRITQEVEHGKIGVVFLPDEELAALRRITYQDGLIILKADNPAYDPIALKEEHVRIVGQAIKKASDL